MSEYIKKSDVRHLLLHQDREAALAQLDELEGLDPALTKSVELLDMNYKTAEQMEYVRNPISFALYCTWKTVDGKWGISPIDEMKGDRNGDH